LPNANLFAIRQVHPLQTLVAIDSHVFDGFVGVQSIGSTDLMIWKVTSTIVMLLSRRVGRSIEMAGEIVSVGFCKISVVLSDAKTIVT
jgi:hypothetical protein